MLSNYLTLAEGALSAGGGTRITAIVPTRAGGVRARLESIGFRVLRQFGKKLASRAFGRSTVHVAPESDVSV